MKHRFTKANPTATKTRSTPRDRAGDAVWKGAGLELDFPDRLVQPGAWVGHIPFAFFLVEALRPRMVVELGVHTGNSFCAFAQAVAKVGLKSRCIGVDHWKGDEQSGFYGESVFQEFRAYHDLRYGTFSSLFRMTFDEALGHVADGSVDLLHIDGFHTYESVKHDFENWLPKTSTRGVVIFHDINVHERDFGAWRFWNEIQSQFPAFVFLHSHGLGLIYVGSEPPPRRLAALLESARRPKSYSLAQQYFARLGAAVSDKLALTVVGTSKAALEARAVAAERQTAELAAARAQDAQAVGQVSELRAKFAAAQEKAAQAVTQNAALETARADLAGRLEEARAQATELLGARDALKRHAQQQASQIEGITKELDTARNQATELLAARDALNGELEQVRAEAQKLESQVRAAETHTQAQVFRIDGMTKELDRLARTADARAQHHGLKINRLTKDLDEARASAARTVAEQEASEHQIEEARSSARKFALRLQEAETRTLQQEVQTESLTKEIEKLRASLDQAALEREQQIAALRASLTQDQEQAVNSLQATLKRAVQDRENETKALRTKLDQAVLKREQEIERLRADLKQAIQEREQAIKTLTNSVSWRIAAPMRLAAQWVAGLRRWRQGEVTSSSDLFDGDWYLTQYLDVAAAGLDPLQHYLIWGALGGRKPGPHFDTRQVVMQSGLFDNDWYLSQYPDVAAAGVDPLQHYLHSGVLEGRDPSPRFDTDWYLAQYTDVASAGISPLLHFILAGCSEGRAPRSEDLASVAELSSAAAPSAPSQVAVRCAPDERPLRHNEQTDKIGSPSTTTTTGLSLAGAGAASEKQTPRRDAAETKIQPSPETAARGPIVPPRQTVASELTRGAAVEPKAAVVEPPPGGHSGNRLPTVERILGQLDRRRERPTVLLCAHTVGTSLYGSERSLLDLLDAFQSLNYDVLVTVPNRRNALYINELSKRSLAVYVFQYAWWKKDKPIDTGVVEAFYEIIAKHAVDVVHANTIMLREPLLAARKMGVKSVVHAREVIDYDAPLCDYIGDTAKTIVNGIATSTDYVFANSAATARCYKNNNLFLINNCVDVDTFDIPNRLGAETVSVALISSNIPKKGIYDFVRIAKQLTDTPARFLLIGEESEFILQLKSAQLAGRVPSNVTFAGYCPSPVEAIAKANVVVNLSHFQESFGRSVLEALAARRPVVAYDWGAVSELVRDGTNGFLVSFLDTEAAGERIKKLCLDPSLILSLGEAGRAIAISNYGRDVFAERLREAYEQILEGAGKIRVETDTASSRPDVARGETSSPSIKMEPKGEVIALRRRKGRPGAARKLKARALACPERPRSIAQDPLRIAYFVWHFPVPSETFVLNELRQLVALGHDVLVFCRQSPHPDFKPNFPITWQRVASPAELASRLRATNRQIVHSHFVYPTVTDFAWPACEEAQIPFTFIPHAQDIFRQANIEKARLAEIAASRWCRRIFTPSRFHRNYLIERGVPAEKIVINPNGIELPSVAPGADHAKRSFRRVCAVHRFTEKKGLEYLIAAAKLLEEDGIEVDIYGYGPLQSTYESLIAKSAIRNCHLHGAINGSAELLKVFETHDLFVCPSVRAQDGDMDGIPTVLMEAMSALLPVLATAISGIPDLVSDGVTGLHCDATAEGIATAIRRFYRMPKARVAALVQNGQRRVADQYDTRKLVNTLLRVWRNQTVDVLIVSWNNLSQLKEVIRRLYAFTSLPFHLVVCDNRSEPDVVEFLDELHASTDNLTVIFNDENEFVGPGINRALEESWSDYAIYVCGKEGFAMAPGWEIPFINFMDGNPKVGLAGTLCYSPSYQTGKDYPVGIPAFSKFRNPEFAARSPDRFFQHIQGGVFAIRREMYKEIGGFSVAVPHNYTDVEYSYYVESCAWELAEVPHLLSLYHKTRPGIASRVDEGVYMLHPGTLEDLPWLDGLVQQRIAHCNLCNWSGEAFKGEDGAETCPSCGALPADRTLYRWLSESALTYRRLPALAVDLAAPMREIWSCNFQGSMMTGRELLETLKRKGRLRNKDESLRIAYFGDPEILTEGQVRPAQEMARLIGRSGVLLVQNARNAEQVDADGISREIAANGFKDCERVQFGSTVVRYDWSPLMVFRKAPSGLAEPRAETHAEKALGKPRIGRAP